MAVNFMLARLSSQCLDCPFCEIVEADCLPGLKHVPLDRCTVIDRNWYVLRIRDRLLKEIAQQTGLIG